MASIQTSIELQDRFTNVMRQVVRSVELGVSAMESMKNSMNQPIDTAEILAMRDACADATDALRQFEETAAIPISPNIAKQTKLPVTPVVAEPVQIDAPGNVTVDVTPVVTEQPDLNIPESVTVGVQAATSTAEQRIAEIQQRLNDVNRTQEAINTVAKNAYILPEDAQQELTSVNHEIRRMQAALDYIQNNPFNLDSSFAELQIDSLKNSINIAIERQRELNSQLGNIPEQILSVQIQPEVPDPIVEQPEPVRIPIQWQTDNMEVFSGNGMARFRQEVHSAQGMLSKLRFSQLEIAETADRTEIFPKNALSDLSGVQNRLQAIHQRMRAIESNPVNLGSDAANAGLEQLRGQLGAALNAQELLNRAVANMDVQAANEAYIQLSRTVSNTEQYIRDNTNAQGQFNRAIEQGKNSANGLAQMVKRAVGAYASLQSIKKVINLSDQLASTDARLNMLNRKFGENADLQSMIFASAQRSRGAYQATADSVGKLGVLTGDVFKNTGEVVAFSEQLNRHFVVAGTETSGINAAMLQLTQAMGSGVLRGEEFNSVLEQAPTVIAAIATYMGKPRGELKELAADGKITAEIVKNAMLQCSDEVNEQFENMPMTFAQIGTSVQNNAMMAFQPVLQQLTAIGNSDAFRQFVNGAIQGIFVLARVVTTVFGGIVRAGGATAENWAIIAPVIGTVATAILAVAAAMAISNAVTTIATGLDALHAAAMKFKAKQSMKEAVAAAAAAGAQNAYNIALLACPVTWIIVAIVALIAVVIAFTNHIANAGGTATTAFGVICGAVNVVVQFVWNLLLCIGNFCNAINEACNAVADNMITGFHNAIANVKSNFYSLLSTALTVVEGICMALNSLPFIEFNFSGVTDAADAYAQKSAEAANSKQEYVNVSDAFHAGLGKYEAFQDGWARSAYDAGAIWGDEKWNTLKEKFSFTTDFMQTSTMFNLDSIADQTGAIADNTDQISDTLSGGSDEWLSLLRSMAERESINRFTTAKIDVSVSSNADIHSDTDLDGFFNRLTDELQAAVVTGAARLEV